VSRSAPALLGAAVILTAVNLRTPVGSVPPVVDEIVDDVGLSAAAAGLLTTLPVLCFGLFAPASPVLARRLGAERVLLVALVPILIGLLVRSAPSTAALFAGTLLAGAGIAVGNVIVPAVLKGRFATSVGPLTGIYSAALGGGAAIAAGLTVPIQSALGVDWRVALAFWALPAALAIVVVFAALVRDRATTTARGEPGAALSLLGDGLAWQVTLFMGLQSLLFYAGLAWLPSILRDEGYSAETAGGLLALYALGGVPASLLSPVLATRLRTQGSLTTVVAGGMAAGLTGLLVAPSAAVVWVAVLALSQGAALGIALTIIILRAPDARRAAELSGMAQTIGYGLAAAGPLVLGLLHDASGGWELPLAVLLALTVPLVAVGLGAGRARWVGAAHDNPAQVSA
jgi:CP family cyanate transporter-like MFS transporter